MCQDKGVKVGVKKEHYDTFIEALQGHRFQQVISRSKVKHLLEFPSLIKAHDIHDKAQDMATIILQEEAATRAMIEKDQEQPQSSRGGRPPKNAKGGGRKPLAQLIGQASNADHVWQSTVRPTGKENKTKRAIKKKKKGVKVRSLKLQRTNYSQSEAHVRLTEAVKCAEELKTLRVNGEAAPQEWGGVWPSQKCIAMKYKVARSQSWAITILLVLKLRVLATIVICNIYRNYLDV